MGVHVIFMELKMFRFLSDSKFTQQELPACKPILTPRWVSFYHSFYLVSSDANDCSKLLTPNISLCAGSVCIHACCHCLHPYRHCLLAWFPRCEL